MMEILLVAVPLVVVWTLAVRAEQAQRVLLLASHLGRYRIEKLMEALSEGYLRALAEKDAERQRALWSTLSLTEANLLDEFNRFVVDMAGVWPEKALVSRIPQAVPRATLLFPQATFDLRKMLAIHAKALDRLVARPVGEDNPQARRDRAFTFTAELLLIQHTCLWFCRSQTSASARLLARHGSSYAQVLGAVSSQTRADYCALAGCRK
jgi:hypothetical protein